MSSNVGILPVNSLVGMTVLSLATGNKLGQVRECFVDPINGVLLGFTIAAADGSTADLSYDSVHSFGRDAIMAAADDAIRPQTENSVPNHQSAKKLIGTKIITESGNLLGHIADIFVTLSPPPVVLYEIRESVLDRLLGRQLFIPASAGHALSDDGERLVVPDTTMETAAPSVLDLLDGRISVRSFEPGQRDLSDDRDQTLVVVPDEDETVIRAIDEDETVVRLHDDD